MESDKIQLEAPKIPFNFVMVFLVEADSQPRQKTSVTYFFLFWKAEKVRQALLERKKQEFEEEKKKAEADLRRKAGRKADSIRPMGRHVVNSDSQGRSRASPTGDGSEEPEESTNPGDA